MFHESAFCWPAKFSQAALRLVLTSAIVQNIRCACQNNDVGEYDPACQLSNSIIFSVLLFLQYTTALVNIATLMQTRHRSKQCPPLARNIGEFCLDVYASKSNWLSVNSSKNWCKSAFPTAHKKPHWVFTSRGFIQFLALWSAIQRLEENYIPHRRGLRLP